jgi:hypothetical protein
MIDMGKKAEENRRIDLRCQPLKGHLISQITASLKRCPDTNPGSCAGSKGQELRAKGERRWFPEATN